MPSMQSRNDSGERPTKRLRTEERTARGISEPNPDTNDQSISGSSNATEIGNLPEGPSNGRARTRSVIACETCRLRKTKCDNRRPTCGYCTKTRTGCVYDDGQAGGSLVTVELVNAISHLTTLLERQQSQQLLLDSCSRISAAQATVIQSILSAKASSDDSANQTQMSHRSRDSNASGLKKYAISGDDPSFVRSKSSAPLNEGLESVLRWSIFPRAYSKVDLLADFESDAAFGRPVPKFDLSQLTLLKARYINAVHIKNPILDLQRLQDLVSDVSEAGPDWSTKTCLVALVGALGAQSEAYTAGSRHDGLSSPTSDLNKGLTEQETELAMQYWDVAKRRLGYALEHRSLEAVQCLCLAGIWYMHRFEPIQAWKYFSYAGDAWVAATLRSRSSIDAAIVNGSSERSLMLEQTLYFTIYKSECELRLELSTPKSILEDMDISYDFPLIPASIDGGSDADSDAFDKERTWYFYLAEIASRHVANRILQERSPFVDRPSIHQIQGMIAEYELFESQANTWYSSLPSTIAFPLPQGPIAEALPEELMNLLQSRYLTILEFCSRPFIRLCTTYELHLGADLMSRVTSIAQQDIHRCLYRVQSINVQRHHGLWLAIRSFFTCAMILIAVDRAKRDPNLNGARFLNLPDNWRIHIQETKERLTPYLNIRQGGIDECSRILDWALAEPSAGDI